jgi:hypothetical protein
MIQSVSRKAISLRNFVEVRGIQRLLCTSTTGQPPILADTKSEAADETQYYRTKENNPINHDSRHIGRLYTVISSIFFIALISNH